MWKKILTATGPLLFACATSALPAAEKLDLERIKPVPATEPVPIADFFRQPLFWGPKLNPSGTHFAALVSPEKDRTALLVGDIAKGKINVVKGIADRDVYWFAWLTPTRLLFSLTSEKRYADGLMVADIDSLSDNYAVELHNATSLVGVPKKSPLRPLVWIEQNAYDDGKDDGVVQIDTTKKVRDDRNLFDGTPGDRNLAENRPGEAPPQRACDALDALVCADVGVGVGCLRAACLAGQVALATRLDAAFELADGDGSDLQLSGSASMVDSDGDGVADKLGTTVEGSGLWTAQIRAHAGTEIVSGSWTGSPQPP